MASLFKCYLLSLKREGLVKQVTKPPPFTFAPLFLKPEKEIVRVDVFYPRPTHPLSAVEG